MRWLESTEKKLVEVVDTKAFAQMRRLRLLQLNNLRVEGDYGLISKELRWLSWHGFHLNFMPDEFYMGNLVAIDMQYSKLRATWKTPKVRAIILFFLVIVWASLISISINTKMNNDIHKIHKGSPSPPPPPIRHLLRQKELPIWLL